MSEHLISRRQVVFAWLRGLIDSICSAYSEFLPVYTCDIFHNEYHVKILLHTFIIVSRLNIHHIKHGNLMHNIQNHSKQNYERL